MKTKQFQITFEVLSDVTEMGLTALLQGAIVGRNKADLEMLKHIVVKIGDIDIIREVDQRI